MRKYLGLVGLACLFAIASIPSVVLADVQNDGSQVFEDTTNLVVIDTAGYATGAPRYFTPGEAWGNQTTALTVPMSALIPCHLEMNFYGNDMNIDFESYGPGGKAEKTTANYVAFHPAVGGYVDSNWQYVGGSTSNNAEIEPGQGYYIRGCDTFKTELWSNLNYKYSVEVVGGALTGGTASTPLPVQMRASIFEKGMTAKNFSDLVATDWTDKGTFTSAPMVLVNGGNILQSSTIYQQFRVPFDRATAAGHYTGSVVFTATTI